MLKASQAALPADVAVMVAAVSDWRPARPTAEKIKKKKDGGAPTITFEETPDILATLSRPGKKRPKLVIGFAAETENVEEHARAKIASKGCDWIVANDVSPASGVMGGDRNTVHIVTRDGVDSWPVMTKDEVAAALVARIADVTKGSAP